MVSFDIIIAKTLYFCYSFVTRVPKCTLTQTILKHCTGTGQAFTIPAAGTYCFECWGGMGGANDVNFRGHGGYTAGKITLTGVRTFYVFVGGEGTQTAGGWNGGGAPGSSSYLKYGGGGATDIRVEVDNESNMTWNNSTSLDSRIMVAAGGGGTLDAKYMSEGGDAGGLNGYGSSSRIVSGFTTKVYWYGGTQTAGATFYGTKTDSGGGNGGFGYGGAGARDWGGGGGSGYYGGCGGTNTPYNSNKTVVGAEMGGTGGSSFISGHAGCIAIVARNNRSQRTGSTNSVEKSKHYSGLIFTEGTTVMIDGSGYQWTTSKGSTIVNVPQTDFYETTNKETTYHGHTGSGFARITQISVD